MNGSSELRARPQRINGALAPTLDAGNVRMGAPGHKCTHCPLWMAMFRLYPTWTVVNSYFVLSGKVFSWLSQSLRHSQDFPVASEGDALLRRNSFPFNSIHFAPYWISGSALVRPFGCQDTTSPAPSMRASMVTQRVPLQLTARRTPEHPGLVRGAQDQGASIQGNRSMDTEIARLRRRRKRPSMPSNCGRASCIG